MSVPRLAALVTFALATPWLHAETLEMRVNGVPMQLAHGQGAAAHDLLRRRAREFDRSPERRLEVGGWMLRSIVHGQRSFALQQRGAGDALEVVYSVIDLSANPHRPPALPLQFPLDTEVGATVETLGATPSRQWTLRIRRPLSSVVEELRARAGAEGWAAAGDAVNGLALTRGSHHLQIVFAPEGDAHATRLMLLAWSGS